MKERTPSRPLFPWSTKDLTAHSAITSSLSHLERERTHVFWLPSYIPWVEVEVVVYLTSWGMRVKCARAPGYPASTHYTIADAAAPRDDRLGNSPAGPRPKPKPKGECHVHVKVRFAHFPVPFQFPRGRRRTTPVRTKMKERFVFASSTMLLKAMMVF